MLTRREHEKVVKELDRARDRADEAKRSLADRIERERLRAKLFGDPVVRPYNHSADTIEARRRAQPPAEIPQRFEGYSLRAAVAAATPPYVPTKVLTGNDAYFEILKQQFGELRS